MSFYQQLTNGLPLEREFEAWIIAGIEQYFESLEISFAIWAVSPIEETTWPVDEELNFGTKLIGLQFKRPKLAATKWGARLGWDLSQPTTQFGKVKQHPEVFYCLPTFVNRQVRKRALDQCLFWRPRRSNNKSVWYDHPEARTPYRSELKAMRWGLFIEQVLSCEIGALIESPLEGHVNIIDLQRRMTDAKEGAESGGDDGGLYFAVVKIPR